MILDELHHWLVAPVAEMLPARIRAWVAGPRGQVIVYGDGHYEVLGLRRFRPCEVLIDESHVLRLSYSLPAEAERDYRSAINLQLASSTPFERDELIVGQDISPHPHEGDLRRVDVVAVQSTLINGAIRANGLRRKQVRRIATLAEPRNEFEFAPRRSLSAAISVGVVVWLLLATAWAAVEQRMASANTITLLEHDIDQVRSRVKELSAEADLRRQIEQANATRLHQEARISTITDTLTSLDAALSEDLEILRIDIRSDGARVGLRSPDVMRAIRDLQANLPKWEVGLEGGISVDGATRSEIATALMQKRI